MSSFPIFNYLYVYRLGTFFKSDVFVVDRFVIVCSAAAASVMEQVAAVLDALSDAKETTRQQVIGLVERIALRLEKVESKNQQLVRENELLKDQLNMVGVGNASTAVVNLYNVKRRNSYENLAVKTIV